MYSDKDFQTFWFRYKTEGEPHGISINSFCINQGVPYKQFYAWFKKHAKDTVIPVEIEGAPTDEETDDVEVPPQPASKPKASKGGILITIQTTDGLFVNKGGLDYGGMKDDNFYYLPMLHDKSRGTQVFAYRNDGEYSIDNLAAERAIRPQTIQRKGSLFFGSVQGALRSAMYNTFIQTCKQVGVSFRQYFKALLKAVKSGRTDYENLLPMTICLD